MAELRQELALCRELEDLGVLVAVSRQPDVVFGIDKDAVLGGRPLVALARAAAGCEQLAVLLELEHGRCRAAAIRPGRRHGRATETLVLLQLSRPLQHPDAPVAVDGHYSAPA